MEFSDDLRHRDSYYVIVMYNFHETRVIIVFLDSSPNTFNIIFKTNKWSSICKIYSSKFSHATLLSANNCIITFSSELYT